MLAVSRPWRRRAVHCCRTFAVPRPLGLSEQRWSCSSCCEILTHRRYDATSEHFCWLCCSRWATHAGVEHPLRTAVPLFPLSAEPAAMFARRSNNFHRLSIVTFLENFHASDHCRPSHSTQLPVAAAFERPCMFPRQPEKPPCLFPSPQLIVRFVLDLKLNFHQVPREPWLLFRPCVGIPLIPEMSANRLTALHLIPQQSATSLNLNNMQRARPRLSLDRWRLRYR